MRIQWVFLLAAIGLVGCNSDHSSQANDSANTPSSASAKSGAHAKQSAAPGINAVLKTLSQTEKTNLRYDRVVEAKTVGMQRQVFVEMLGATDREAAATVAKAFDAQGFTLHRGKDDENGIRLRFVKDSIEPIEVLIRSRQEGPKLKDVAATSSVYLRQASK